MAHEVPIPRQAQQAAEQDEIDQAAEQEALSQQGTPAEPVLDHVIEQPEEDEQPAPVAAAVPDQATLAPAPVAEEGEPVESLVDLKRRLLEAEHRNRTLQGMIHSQKPEAEEMAALKDRIAELENRPEEHVAPAEPGVAAHLRYLNKDEREAVDGEEGSLEVRMAKGMAEEGIEKVKREAAQEALKLTRRIDAIERRQEDDDSDSAVSGVMAQVEELMPGAIKINSDILWVDWLEGADPESATGATYGAKGQALMAIGDTKGIVDLMNKFLADVPEASDQIKAQIRPAKSSVVPTEGKPVKKQGIPESRAVAFYKAQRVG